MTKASLSGQISFLASIVTAGIADGSDCTIRGTLSAGRMKSANAG
jgi:hypothetical protein